MSESSQYRSLSVELNKLNKPQLVVIIIRKAIPEGVKVSEELQRCIDDPPNGNEVEISELKKKE